MKMSHGAKVKFSFLNNRSLLVDADLYNYIPSFSIKVFLGTAVALGLAGVMTFAQRGLS
jgi:hypothetical protein